MNGIDVSHYQGTVDWTKVRASGIQFCFIKATEGLSIVDSAFTRNWREAGTAGVIRGAYHFFLPTVSAAMQADLFLRTVRVTTGNLPPVVDLEGADWLKTPKASRIPMILDWLKRVELGTGAVPIIYLSPAFATEQLYNDPALARYPLWLAQYGHTPQVPKPWTSWTFWQSNGNGTVDGVPAPVDLDSFNGTLDQLKALTLS